MQALVTHLLKAEIPKSVDEALQNPEWKAVVIEEMNALKKMELGKLLISRKERVQLDVGGSSL